MNLDQLYPYLVPGLLNPDWEPACVPVGHGVWVQLFEDTTSANGIVHAAVSPDQLASAGLSAGDAHEQALANLVRFADDSPDLSIQMLGEVGDPVHFLLYCDHPRAAACLLLPDLYEQACDLLKTSEVCAVVPQRESLVVLPKRDRAYREMMVAKLRELEADARRPISFGLFELTADGVSEFHEA
ncbi:hypothetical protein [Urbifossiella limnaea]|uniref:Uncharacterized protein n=1 Tax=Urbifossiella limnaea TaxID=2528023 RepID=A0A517XSK1_9BACT|nr:hypothetical protein [Urbifossiella limnaea]QDU20490.1 hypothetical protein ETAA1_24420 [Urbifossiella limnaea]